MPATKARHEFADMVNRVARDGERIVLERHGKAVAVMVPVADLELLQKLEDHLDLEAATKAIADAKRRGTRSLAEVRAKVLSRRATKKK